MPLKQRYTAVMQIGYVDFALLGQGIISPQGYEEAVRCDGVGTHAALLL